MYCAHRIRRGAVMVCDQFIFQEYFKLVDVIDAYDTRLLVIKGWSVTFSLVMLGLAFEKKVRLLFLVASISSICFFLLDITYKNYQTNYYSRMNQIEVVCSKQVTDNKGNKESVKLSPRPGIDWVWWQANDNKIMGEILGPISPKKPITIWDSLKSLGTWLPYIFPFFFGILFWFIYPKIDSRANQP